MSSNSPGHRLAVADVERMVLEVGTGLLEVAEGPGGISARAEEVGPHVVVDPVDLVAAAVKVADRLGADQPTASGDEHLHAG